MASFAALSAAQQLMAVSAIVSVASTAYSTYSTRQTAKFNEKVAGQEADYQRQLADVKADRQRRSLKKAIGEQTVAAGTSGVSLLSGSIMDAFTESTSEGLFDTMMIRAGGKAAERGSLIQAEQFKAEGESAVVGGALSIGSSILQTKSSLSE